VKFSEMHAGAKIKEDNFSFKNQPLSLSLSVFQVPSQSGSSNLETIQTEKGIVNLCNGQNFIINGSNAPYADMFCALERTKPEPVQLINETIQTKHLKTTKISNELFKREEEKAAGKDDTFLLITSGTCQVNIDQLKSGSGYVDRTNWHEYFGPFAGRAFIFAKQPPDINKAPFSWLDMMHGIVPVTANTILAKRKLKEFSSDIEECFQRTKINKTILQQFQNFSKQS